MNDQQRLLDRVNDTGTEGSSKKILPGTAGHHGKETSFGNMKMTKTKKYKLYKRGFLGVVVIGLIIALSLGLQPGDKPTPPGPGPNPGPPPTPPGDFYNPYSVDNSSINQKVNVVTGNLIASDSYIEAMKSKPIMGVSDDVIKADPR
jgi:hypothetical protein